jgi:hypothetical protein
MTSEDLAGVGVYLALVPVCEGTGLDDCDGSECCFPVAD